MSALERARVWALMLLCRSLMRGYHWALRWYPVVPDVVARKMYAHAYACRIMAEPTDAARRDAMRRGVEPWL